MRCQLCRLTGKRIFLFIDKIALHVDAVQALFATARSNSTPITIIGAERLNEWNVYCEKLQQTAKPTEIAVRNLSMPEIESLLDLLTRHNALGCLSGESRAAQIRAFSERAERQLLVALHEATHGKPFEQIVYDEYIGIVPEQARRLYLDICTMHQFNVPARAGTISRISGIHFTDYKAKFIKPLENVVLTDRDRYTGDYHYKARHARIAQIVFHRVCVTDQERADQLIRIASSLDIGYSADSKALAEIVRAKRLRDELNTVEPGRSIYRAALEAAPDTPFMI